jgi:hypothetical protein
MYKKYIGIGSKSKITLKAFLDLVIQLIFAMIDALFLVSKI